MPSQNNSPVLVVAAVIVQDRKVLIVRRGPGMSGAGHWEFPGGKVEAGESSEQALQRELLEELGLSVHVGSYIGDTLHAYPSKKIHLHFYWVEMPNQPLRLIEHDASLWVRIADLDIQSLSAADRPIVDVLKKSPRLQ